MSSFVRLMLVAGAAALALGCGSKAPAQTGPAVPVTASTNAPANVYVVPSDRAAKFYGEKAEGFFTPDDTLISAIEGALPMFLGSSEDQRAQTITPKLDGYKRQYVGVVIDGQRMVFGNFFCNTKLSVKQPQLVDDGGSCYFNVLFDVGSRTFPKLRINGDA